MEVVLRAMAEIFEVLDVEVVDSEPHAQIFGANSHLISPSILFRHSRESGNPGPRVQAFALDPRLRGGDETGPFQPRRMTIEEAVDGLAQPRLALTSTFVT